MFNESYIATQNQPGAARFSGIFDNIIKGINAGLQVFSSVQGSGLLGQPGVPTGGAPARGLAQITSTTNQALAALDALIAQIGRQPYEQIYQSAQQIVGALSNPNVIYQAKNGQDAAVLASAKTKANQKLQQIVASSGSITGNTVNAAGQVISSGGNVVSTGFDTLSNNPWLYVALGAAGIYFLTKKK